jgi:prepilin-type processing-associated H-X9-DG protein
MPQMGVDTTTTEHPARAASRRSMEIVQRKVRRPGDKEEWLALFTDDAIIEDPIGRSPLDPEGMGHRGKAAIAAFWDAHVASIGITLDIERSYACGNEVANVGTITTRMPDGSTAVVEGVFTYRVNDAGKLTWLRAYWEFDKMMASVRKA